MNRQFGAPRPNMLWLSDLAYVATWDGFVYVAFVIDAFARRMSVDGFPGPPMRASSSTPWSSPRMNAAPFRAAGLAHHSDRGSQYVSIKYTERPTKPPN